MTIRTRCAALGAAAMLLAVSTAAQAADPAFCRNYATAAMRQVRAAFETPRCAMGAGGSRWSRRYEVHFNWCLGAPYAAAGRERDARTYYLRGCR